MSFKVKQSKHYAAMPVYHLKDTELSMQAKGFYSWLQLPDSTWTGEFEDIFRFHIGLTRTELIKILNELQNNGYLEIKNDEYIVLDKPKTKKISELKPIELDNAANSNLEPKDNLFTKCHRFIEEYTDDEHLRNVLKVYLNLRLNPGKDSRLAKYKLTFFNQWRNIVLELDTLEGDKVKIVEQSIAKHWAKFFDIKRNKTMDGVTSNSYSKEEMEEFRKKLQAKNNQTSVKVDEGVPF